MLSRFNYFFGDEEETLNLMCRRLSPTTQHYIRQPKLLGRNNRITFSNISEKPKKLVKSTISNFPKPKFYTVGCQSARRSNRLFPRDQLPGPGLSESYLTGCGIGRPTACYYTSEEQPGLQGIHCKEKQLLRPKSQPEMASFPVAKQPKTDPKFQFMKNVAKLLQRKCWKLIKNLSTSRKGSFDLNSCDEQMNFTNSPISCNLPLTINNQSVKMIIDSGTHNSIVSRSVWRRLGEPRLEPVTFTLRTSSGAQLKLKGQFMADVNYAGRVYQLPLIVSERPDIDNLLGRRWFPALHLDWNRIFRGAPHRFQPTAESDKRLDSKIMAGQSYCSDHCYVNVNVEGVTLRMMLDTGSTHSDIGLAQWESIGKPRLKATRLKIIDAANDSLPLLGVCTVKVKYCGQEVRLPLVVTGDRTGGGTIGIEWFEKIQFNFNDFPSNYLSSET